MAFMSTGFVGVLLRRHGRTGLRTTWNSHRNFTIPPLNTSFRNTEIDRLHLNNKEAQKIYEIRTYSVRPKYFKEYIKFTEEHFHLRIKYSKLFGFWNTELGSLNEIIHIWEYDSHEHRAKVRQALANDKEWQTNYITKVSPMYIRQTNATMTLLPWSIITLPSKSGLYELQIFNMNSHTDIWDGRLKAAMELSSMKLKSSNSVLVACFTSIFGPHNTEKGVLSIPVSKLGKSLSPQTTISVKNFFDDEVSRQMPGKKDYVSVGKDALVYALWQHESFDKFAFGRLQLLNEPDRSVLHAFYHEVLTGYSKGLNPHKASPLQ